MNSGKVLSSGNRLTALFGSILVAALLLMACSNDLAKCPVYKRIESPDGTVKLESGRLIPEDWIGVNQCFKNKSFRLHFIVIEDNKLVVATDKNGATLFILTPAGLDSYEIERSFAWKGDPISAYREYEKYGPK